MIRLACVIHIFLTLSAIAGNTELEVTVVPKVGKTEKYLCSPDNGGLNKKSGTQKNSNVKRIVNTKHYIRSSNEPLSSQNRLNYTIIGSHVNRLDEYQVSGVLCRAINNITLKEKKTSQCLIIPSGNDESLIFSLINGKADFIILPSYSENKFINSGKGGISLIQTVSKLYDEPLIIIGSKNRNLEKHKKEISFGILNNDKVSADFIDFMKLKTTPNIVKMVDRKALVDAFCAKKIKMVAIHVHPQDKLIQDLIKCKGNIIKLTDNLLNKVSSSGNYRIISLPGKIYNLKDNVKVPSTSVNLLTSVNTPVDKVVSLVKTMELKKPQIITSNDVMLLSNFNVDSGINFPVNPSAQNCFSQKCWLK